MQVRDVLLKSGDLQGAVLWSVFYDSGARRNEVFLVEKAGLLDGNKTNIVIGKRGKKFPLVYLNDTKELIRQYLHERGDDDIPSLWIAKTGSEKKPIQMEALYTRILKCSDILSKIRGEECNIFPHSIRHSRAECLINGEDDRLKDENGENRKYTLEEIRLFLHHESADTTSGYLKDHSEDTIDSMFGIQ
jgi:integrase/recombinase XerD